MTAPEAGRRKAAKPKEATVDETVLVRTRRGRVLTMTREEAEALSARAAENFVSIRQQLDNELAERE